MEGEIQKLEELLRSGFILEDEYNSRKAAILSTSKNVPLDELINKIKSPINTEELTLDIKKLRILVSQDETPTPPVAEIVKTNILPTLYAYLSAPDVADPLVVEILWTLTNISAIEKQYCKLLVDMGFLTLYIKFLQSNDLGVVEQAAWAIGNIANADSQYRDLILNNNVVEPLSNIIRNNSTQVSLIRNSTWSLNTLCRGKPAPSFAIVKPLANLFAMLLYSDDDELLCDALWGLVYLSEEGNKNKIQNIVESGAMRKVVHHLGSEQFSVTTPALRIVHNVASGDDIHKQILLNLKVMDHLCKLLKSYKKGIVTEAVRCVGELAAGNRSQLQTIMDSGALSTLSNHAMNKELDIKKVSLFAIVNATRSALPDQMNTLVKEMRIMKPLISLLDCGDNTVVLSALEGLENSKIFSNQEITTVRPYVAQLQKLSGLDKLESLKHKGSDEAKGKVDELIEMLGLSEEEGEEEEEEEKEEEENDEEDED